MLCAKPGPKSPSSSPSPDATKITLAPSSADINVGENLTLQCHASHDPTMDLTFTWSLDDFPIDLDKSEGHYRRASVVSTEGNCIPTRRQKSHTSPFVCMLGCGQLCFPAVLSPYTEGSCWGPCHRQCPAEALGAVHMHSPNGCGQHFGVGHADCQR